MVDIITCRRSTCQCSASPEARRYSHYLVMIDQVRDQKRKLKRDEKMGLLTEIELAGGGIGAEDERGRARRRDEMGVDSVYAAACGGGRIHFPIRNLKKERERENVPDNFFFLTMARFSNSVDVVIS